MKTNYTNKEKAHHFTVLCPVGNRYMFFSKLLNDRFYT